MSDNDENGRFFPDRGELNFDTASLFFNSSNNFILSPTFLLLISSSAIAASIRSEPTNLEGLESAAFIAICAFLIKNSNSQPSGLTFKPLLSVDITLTVIV